MADPSLNSCREVPILDWLYSTVYHHLVKWPFSQCPAQFVYTYLEGGVRTKKERDTRVNRWVRRASGERGDRPRFISYSPYVPQSKWGEGRRLTGALTISFCVLASCGLQFCCLTSSPSSGRASVRSCQFGLSCSGLSPFLSAVSWSILDSLPESCLPSLW